MKRLLLCLAALGFATAAHATDISLDGNLLLNSTSTSTSTCNSKACLLTTPSLTNVSGSEYSITITNSAATAGDIAICSVVGGANTGGQPLCQAIPAAGSVAVTIANSGATAFDGAIKFLLWILKP